MSGIAWHWNRSSVKWSVWIRRHSVFSAELSCSRNWNAQKLIVAENLDVDIKLMCEKGVQWVKHRMRCRNTHTSVRTKQTFAHMDLRGESGFWFHSDAKCTLLCVFPAMPYTILWLHWMFVCVFVHNTHAAMNISNWLPPPAPMPHSHSSGRYPYLRQRRSKCWGCGAVVRPINWTNGGLTALCALRGGTPTTSSRTGWKGWRLRGGGGSKQQLWAMVDPI